MGGKGKMAHPRLAALLAGNPNSGKTSLFNWMAGAHQHVGNYPGVTVEKKSATFVRDGVEIELTPDGVLAELERDAGMALDASDRLDGDGAAHGVKSPR